MFEMRGKYTTAKVMIDPVEQACIGQIQGFLSHPVFTNPVAIMPDCHAGKGSVVGFTMPMGTKIIPNIIGVDIGCVDGETEYLSPSGWKKIKDYSEGKVMQYEPESGLGHFVAPSAFIKQPCERFIQIQNKYGVSQVLSPEHRCLVYRYDRSYSFSKSSVVTAEEIFREHSKLKNGYRHRFLTAFKADISTSVELTDPDLRVMVMMCADGHLNKNGKTCNLQFKKIRKYLRAKMLLNEAGIDFDDRSKGDVYRINFMPPIFKKGLHQFWLADQRQLQIIGDEVIHWDGNADQQCFYTRIKEEADFINYVFSATGFRSTIFIDYRDSAVDYRVFRYLNTKIGINSTPKTEIHEIIIQGGYKYCFSVPSTFLILRRDGNVFVTGNCGMLSVNLGPDLKLPLPEVDLKIRQHVPFGFNIHDKSVLDMKKEFPWRRACSEAQKFALAYQEKFGTGMDLPVYDMDWFTSKCSRIGCDLGRGIKSLGTLGGGNHFIEIGIDTKGNHWLTIHTGSRNFGKCICEYWQDKAIKKVKKQSKEDRQKAIKELKATYTGKELYDRIKAFKGAPEEVEPPEYGCSDELRWLEGEDALGYLFDMVFAQIYAETNRKLILASIIEALKIEPVDYAFMCKDTIETIHNFIDFKDFIVRKGAIRSYAGERMILPFNMRDGILLCEGKSNPDWNYSAPHGAGRVLSRGQAKKRIDLETFKEQMKDIYSTSVCAGTLDEAPDAYKDAKLIEKAIEPTATIIDRIKPILNMKATEAEEA
jgi:RNA-splicing ligase RtcB